MSNDNVSDFVSFQKQRISNMHPQPLNAGGGGGTYDVMEARVSRLEEDLRDVRSDLKAIRVDLAEIKGKLSNMPSTWQMIGLVVALLGLAFVILKLALPGTP